MPSPSSVTAVELELKAGPSLGRSLAKELAADAGSQSATYLPPGKRSCRGCSNRSEAGTHAPSLDDRFFLISRIKNRLHFRHPNLD